ncbi:hypothetical protein [Kineococcus sp. NPDC059986]|uniref:hypothetical protein n=1 Tax=Kineococcus sp. NPDC059986 TaxID=3155538 RepID=UPI00344C75E0
MDAAPYAVEHDDLPRDDVEALVRSVLGYLAPRAAVVETDLPAHEPGTWAPDVEATAGLLRRHSHVDPDPRRYEYATAVVAADPRLWNAFVLVAPHAYDAEVRDVDGGEVASLSDEGSLVVHLNAEQHEHLAAVTGAHRLRLLGSPTPRRQRRWWRRLDT